MLYWISEIRRSATLIRRAAPPLLLACGLALTLGACSDDDDGMTGINPFGCKADTDCGSDMWCRERSDQITECVLFAQEGERCNGLVPPDQLGRCAPDLICTDYPEPTQDVPGFCRRPG